MRFTKGRPTLRSVIGRGHMILALVAVTLASVSLTLLGVLALRVYAEHNLHLIARSINYTVEAAVVFNDRAAATEALSLIASTEEVAQAQVFDANGRLLNPNFTDYKIPTTLDCPAEIIPIILETPQPDGPFGARGVGEHTMVACAPMVADAIDNAIGIRLKTMPLTAEKVALALRGIDYDSVKGDTLGFCFRGKPCDYRFEVGGH